MFIICVTNTSSNSNIHADNHRKLFGFVSCYKGAITKRMTAIEEMAAMDVLCSDKTGTLTLNRLTVDRNLVEVQTMLPSREPVTFYFIGKNVSLYAV